MAKKRAKKTTAPPVWAGLAMVEQLYGTAAPDSHLRHIVKPDFVRAYLALDEIVELAFSALNPNKGRNTAHQNWAACARLSLFLRRCAGDVPARAPAE